MSGIAELMKSTSQAIYFGLQRFVLYDFDHVISDSYPEVLASRYLCLATVAHTAAGVTLFKAENARAIEAFVSLADKPPLDLNRCQEPPDQTSAS